MKSYPSPVDAMANAIGESQPEDGRACWVWHGRTRQQVAEELRQDDPPQYEQAMASAVAEEFNFQMGACEHACWYKDGQFVDLLLDGSVEMLEKPTHWQYREGPSYQQQEEQVQLLQQSGVGSLLQAMKNSGLTLIPMGVVRLTKKGSNDRESN